MSQRCALRYIWLITLSVALASLTATGCAGVEIVDRAPVSLNTVSVGKNTTPIEEHDLAVLAIDFDPSLDATQIMVKDKRATLLVAVENVGLQAEYDVKVKARLSDYEDETLILEKTCYIDSIAPGQIKIARFKGIYRIPYRSSYRLKVWVVPVDGETGLANNQKSYDLYINIPQR